ncbi:MAG: hypothetical protein Q7R33_04905 [Nitrosarchaeum sp.]|nr:hypothetical protein [Nitrosarchaeum sp.]
MAIRNILHRNKLEALKTWLGKEVLPPKGQWEVLRWKGPKGQPMRIVFDNNHSCEHLSCNDAAHSTILAFIRFSHGESK